MTHLARRACRILVALLACIGAARAAPPSGKPITIGFDIELTGGLAPNGRAALLAMQIWAHDTNASGGLLGRPVKLVYYDDQSNPALVPGIVTKLLDVDHVDLLIGGNGTNVVAPAMPVAMAHHLTLLGLFGLDVNHAFHYRRYFSIIPAGGMHPTQSFSQGFFAVAAELKPKPKTVALVGADAEFSRNALRGAREMAKQYGFRVVYDGTYPPNTADYTPVVRAIAARHPDLVFVGSYPPDSVGMIRAAREVGLKARMFGGGMVGLQATAIKTELGPALNGIVNYDFWLPVKGLATAHARAFLAEYQKAAAATAGVDKLGFYLPPFAYADLEVLGEAVRGVGGFDQAKLAAYLRTHTFQTVVGPIKFGPNGEWAAPRVLETQFQGVKGNGMAQFADPRTEAILWPPSFRNGSVRTPYQKAAAP
ncbi:MAG: amino acid ABC transporter substrate-binding protein [Rhodospirillales bacterium]|nr:amino acid ABC transporter substrate-binding protein [Rhodospirillales bacterium]